MSCTRRELVTGVPVSFLERAHENLACSSAISPSTPRGHLRRSAEGLNQFQAESHFPEKNSWGTRKKTIITRSCVVCFPAKKGFRKVGEKRKWTGRESCFQCSAYKVIIGIHNCFQLFRIMLLPIIGGMMQVIMMTLMIDFFIDLNFFVIIYTEYNLLFFPNDY